VIALATASLLVPTAVICIRRNREWYCISLRTDDGDEGKDDDEMPISTI